MVEVEFFGDSHAGAWEAYVASHPSATVFHRMAWSQAVVEAYGHRPMHVVAWAGGRLAGLLPLMEVSSAFVGRVLVSVPYATYGGILADSPDIAVAMLEFAQGVCEQRGDRYIELRHRDPVALDLPVMDRYDTFRKQLPDRAEDVLPSLPRKTRSAARKGRAMLGEDAVAIGPEWLDTVYRLYSITLRRLGSPNYRRSFFDALQRRYGDDCVVLVVRDGRRPVAGVVSFVFRDEIVPYFSGSTGDGMRKKANNVMYVSLMEYAIDRGLRWFDFNRTRRDNKGPYDFKRYHGFEPTPLHYQIWLSRSGKMPNLTPSNGKFAFAGHVWRRLPLWLTRRAGGQITKWIP